MATILCLETATTNCSVGLAKEGKLVALQEENNKSYSHSEKLHVFMNAVLQKASLQFSDLDAVAVSMGPGSYTGLRIGVSAAKGLCFALGLPLISIATLESMARQIPAKKDEVIIPVLDARRMEVYSAVFDHSHRQLRKTKAEIIDGDSFSTYRSSFRKVYLVGDGAAKCEGILTHNSIEFLPDNYPSAGEMAAMAFEKFKAGDFEDLAYFEPYYLKDFMAGGKKAGVR